MEDKMEEFIQQVMTINEPKKLFILCGIFIFTDVLTGYLKAFKNRKVNSSISRDGYIKKISWIVALILGFVIDYFVEVQLFLVGSAVVCVATEGISVYENLSELGVSLPFSKYFEKIKEDGEVI
jgi:toxin secretion/phage lysis holin